MRPIVVKSLYLTIFRQIASQLTHERTKNHQIVMSLAHYRDKCRILSKILVLSATFAPKLARPGVAVSLTQDLA